MAVRSVLAGEGIDLRANVGVKNKGQTRKRCHVQAVSKKGGGDFSESFPFWL